MSDKYRNTDGMELLEAWLSLTEEFIQSLGMPDIHQQRPRFDSLLKTIEKIAKKYEPRFQTWSSWISWEVLNDPDRDPSLDKMVSGRRYRKTQLDFDSSGKPKKPNNYEVQVHYGLLIYHLRFAVPLLIMSICDRRRWEIANSLANLDRTLRDVFEGLFMDSDIHLKELSENYTGIRHRFFENEKFTNVKDTKKSSPNEEHPRRGFRSFEQEIESEFFVEAAKEEAIEEDYEVATEVSTDEAIEDEEQRRVQVAIYHQNKRRRTFVKGEKHKIECWIAEEDIEDIRARGISSDPIPDIKLPPEGIMLQVEFIYVYADGQSQSGSIHLPQKSGSSICEFTLKLEPEDDFPTLEIAFLYEGRIFEEVTVNARVVDSPEVEIENSTIQVRTQVKRRQVIDLERKNPMDLSLISGDTETLVFGYGENKRLPLLLSVEDAITWLNDKLFLSEGRLIRESANKNSNYSKVLDVENEEVLKTFRRLAQHGHEIYEHLGRIGQASKHIQVTNLSSDYLQPIEFVYDRGFPSDAATLCEGWEEILSSDVDVCPHCKPREELTEEELSASDTICLLGFWSLRLIIERHQVSKDTEDLKDIEEPREGRSSLRYPTSVLSGFSKNVDLKDQKSTVDEFAKRFKNQSYLASDWKTWVNFVKNESPSLLVALPHQGIVDKQNYLEIGDNVIKGGRINSIYVTRNESDPGPIVILLGCRTQDKSEMGYVSMAGRFQRSRASIVVGTMSKVHGQHAAPIARELVRQLLDVESGEQQFGLLLRRVRRRMLLNGYLIAMGIVALGDADWELSLKKN